MGEQFLRADFGQKQCRTKAVEITKDDESIEKVESQDCRRKGKVGNRLQVPVIKELLGVAKS